MNGLTTHLRTVALIARLLLPFGLLAVLAWHSAEGLARLRRYRRFRRVLGCSPARAWQLSREHYLA